MTGKTKKSSFEDKGDPRRGSRGRRVWTRSVSSMRLLVDLGAAHGLSAAATLAGTGVRERDLDDPTALVLPEQELRTIRNLVTGLPTIATLGIEAGLRYRFTTFGMLGFAMAASRDTGEALALALRYFALTFAFTRFLVTTTAAETVVTVEIDDVPEDLRPFVLARDCAALLRVRADLDPVAGPVIELAFGFPAPRDTAAFRPLLGLEPLFGRPATTLRLASADLTRPLATADPVARAAAEEQCRLLLERRHARTGIAPMIRHRLSRDSRRMPTMEAVADALCTTVRTLRRRLEDEGTTFTALRSEVRRALAEELLSATDLSIEAIAERLGYAEPTSFINAFKAWNGTTPYAWRRRRTASPPR
mgnify:CR=1 FL=1